MIRFIIVMCTAIYVYSFISHNQYKIVNNKNQKPKVKYLINDEHY